MFCEPTLVDCNFERSLAQRCRCEEQEERAEDREEDNRDAVPGL